MINNHIQDYPILVVSTGWPPSEFYAYNFFEEINKL